MTGGGGELVVEVPLDGLDPKKGVEEKVFAVRPGDVIFFRVHWHHYVRPLTPGSSGRGSIVFFTHDEDLHAFAHKRRKRNRRLPACARCRTKKWRTVPKWTPLC